MALGPRLDLRQSQSLVMTPQLQQAIRLLALSNLEIETFIAEELERNPLLEAGGQNVRERAEAPIADEYEAAPEPDAISQLAKADGETALDLGETAQENTHQDSAADSIGSLSGLSASGGSAGPEDGPDFDSFASAGLSLHEHLIAQAGLTFQGGDLLIATALIEQIDEAGYLTANLLDISDRLGAPRAAVERVLETLHTFDPAGVGARSLSECLALQAKEADRYDPAMARLIDNLDYLAKGNLAALRRICGVDDEDLADMIRELRAYDPKPGCRFEQSTRVDAVVADVLVARAAAGWRIELNSATLPRLLVNRTYYAELARGAQDRKSKAWLSDCLQSANWLMKALDQRARTITKVATEIVKQQEEFFRRGVAHLRPLTLRTVAEAVGMHESTISRVTSNKYLSCERGLFELKYFFTSGIQSADGGDAVSAEAVKSHIKALIGAEGDKILSDDQLVDLLKAKGFDIARRTVAKYREAMGIGSSVQRRRQRAISG
ncbi:RNA polymerase factor sigma-54 [Allosphingosinicella vermicomposti]|uniref:RNA polymerase factor sigma-54 n=1 Tax=Allosphingosinicella vermicomposti TaxID=614671 RepID=UPI000D106047|nr:RNA polymerase factor sigma-54 [Allosphingosinicella vermicomposti]